MIDLAGLSRYNVNEAVIYQWMLKASAKEPIPMPGSRKKKTRLIRVENVKAINAYISRVDEMIERKGEWLWH